MTEDRLGRIEGKLDKLAEAVVSLARMEERMVTLFKRMDNYDSAQKSIDGRLKELEKTTVQRTVWEKTFEKGFWIIFGAGVAYILKYHWGA